MIFARSIPASRPGILPLPSGCRGTLSFPLLIDQPGDGKKDRQAGKEKRENVFHIPTAYFFAWKLA
jgi:hypothetical protein